MDISLICKVLGTSEVFVLSQIELTKQFMTGRATFLEYYVASYPFTSATLFHVLLMPIVFITGVLTHDVSQVDRLWSILPTATVLHYAIHSYLNGIGSLRLYIYLAIALSWSIRLTYNFARKGGYNGYEDYRWEVLRSKMSDFQFYVFNALFISIAQLIILLCITAPAVIFVDVGNEGLYTGDYVFATLLAACVILEAAADEYMWNYQSAKHRYKETGEVAKGFTEKVLKRGFCTIGIFAYSRHPNFLAEQCTWVVPYLWSSYLTGKLINWTVIGALMYVCLFQGSTSFTEEITSAKYPEYKDYQKTVGRFIPNIGSHWVEVLEEDQGTNAKL
ncbi:hypothetical protein V1525DRAFT_409866 [Lipomyces kononenkoae]|uniref:Uncharacterized protein n=1 Tax=Lipomyces kononenkoae TaxID=34357 RepID=A0ACC3SV34_LIPKO